ncbi:MAG: tautomerase family protein [Acidimicrobiia bacterium]|nr:tautomerase family protein [Acidimicrobiia bacterium]
MPHVVVKMYQGRTDEQKRALAEAIVADVVAIAGCKESSVSVAVEEFDPADWADAVYRPDIIERRSDLVRAPGYNPFD